MKKYIKLSICLKNKNSRIIGKITSIKKNVIQPNLFSLKSTKSIYGVKIIAAITNKNINTEFKIDNRNRIPSDNLYLRILFNLLSSFRLNISL
jgi:hypothetical protein